MALSSAAKIALQALKDAAATVKSTALSRGDGPQAALAETQRRNADVMAAHNWDTLS